ncbi:diguanylate cyclase [Aestuariibius sp. 2305UL40-4]|uniref:diguanylate cyclase n=1 Tax=Aestuariibius violaceus TaxID=3234132 RepID=UPI00345EF8A7
MSGKILVVDDIATNRIVLKVKLTASLYDIIPCLDMAEAKRALKSQRPDLIVVNLDLPEGEGLTLCQLVRSNPAMAEIPIVGIVDPGPCQRKLDALRLGVDEVLERPVEEALLLARIRSLLRARDASAELRMREDTQRALGFAEPVTTFRQPSHVALVSDRSGVAKAWEVTLVDKRQYYRASVMTLTEAVAADGIDVFLLDGRGHDRHATLRLLSELQSRTHTRHAATILCISDDDPEFAAMALDLGANDLLIAGFTDTELLLRVDAQARRKAQRDRLRDGVRTGLEAALTDPLTGLHNRRYAMSHLSRMAEDARSLGRDYAVMMIDIDHFKRINDRYGHPVGDAVLVALAARLRKALRPEDMLARIGGEEFVVALPGASQVEACATAERLRKLIAACPIDLPEGGSLPMTTSIGVAMAWTTDTPGSLSEALVGRADEALYRSKADGRNKVTLFETSDA